MLTIHLHPAGDAAALSITAKPGQTLMQAAVAANVRGIEAECGGLLTCATCHVLVHEPFLARLPAVSADEEAMLGFTACPRQPNSRLACQIVLDATLDGLSADLPASQV